MPSALVVSNVMVLHNNIERLQVISRNLEVTYSKEKTIYIYEQKEKLLVFPEDKINNVSGGSIGRRKRCILMLFLVGYSQHLVVDLFLTPAGKALM